MRYKHLKQHQPGQTIIRSIVKEFIERYERLSERELVSMRKFAADFNDTEDCPEIQAIDLLLKELKHD